MQLILLDNVRNLGEKGDQVHVKAGYARNFLIPKGYAVIATKKNIELIEARRFELESKSKEAIKIANFRAQKLGELGSINILSKAGEKGKLFGSVGIKDIINAVNDRGGIEVNRNEVRLPNGVLRYIGAHEVYFQFHQKVRVKLIVNVIAESL